MFKLTLQSLVLAALFAVAACSSSPEESSNGPGPDDPGENNNNDSTPDAGEQPIPFNCEGATDEIPDPLQINGVVANLVDDKVIAGATIDAQTKTIGGLNTVVVSQDNGEYQLDLQTGGQPWLGFFDVSHDDYLSTLVYPSALRRNVQDVPIPLLNDGHRFLASALAGVELDEEKGTVVPFFVDCENLGVEGVSYSLNPATEDFFYIIGETADAEATATDANGAAVGFNVQPGTVTVKADYNGITYENQVQVVANAVTIAIFLP
jgi:hypothetical protein